MLRQVLKAEKGTDAIPLLAQAVAGSEGGQRGFNQHTTISENQRRQQNEQKTLIHQSGIVFYYQSGS